jgi:hypothetical protein
MFDCWRQRLAEDSIFRKPLVCEITLVLVVKMVLLAALWLFVFKPLKPAGPANINMHLLPIALAKDIYYV